MVLGAVSTTPSGALRWSFSFPAVHAVVPDVELDLGAGLALEALDDLVHGLIQGGPVADADDLVVRGEAGFVRGPRVDGLVDREQPVEAVFPDVGSLL